MPAAGWEGGRQPKDQSGMKPAGTVQSALLTRILFDRPRKTIVILHCNSGFFNGIVRPMYGRWLANLLIGLLSLWAIYVILSSAIGFLVIFPLVAANDDGVPMLRLLSIRHAFLATFAFYGIMHLLQGSKEVFPIHFLKTFLFFLSLMGFLFGVKDHLAETAVPWTVWALVVFFLWVAMVLHFASAPRYRRYFNKK